MASYNGEQMKSLDYSASMCPSHVPLICFDPACSHLRSRSSFKNILKRDTEYGHDIESRFLKPKYLFTQGAEISIGCPSFR